MAAEKDRKTTGSPKCDNHPDRDAKTYDMGGAIAPINLCEEDVPAWFTDEDLAKAE